MSFQEITEPYLSMINKIQNITIKKMYSQFSFLHFTYQLVNNRNNNQESSPELSLIKYFQNFKLIVFHYYNNLDDIPNINENNGNYDENTIINAFVCVEEKFFILKNIKLSFFMKIIKDQKYSVINLNDKSDKNISIKEEICNFCTYFAKEIDRNGFVKMTIKSIIVFLIHRFFYPTYYFEDPSFFSYNQREKIIEQEIKAKITTLLRNNEFLKRENFSEIMTIVENLQKESEKTNIETFALNKFIVLRTINANDYSLFKLVIHLDNFHVFLIKIFGYDINDDKRIKHEKEFCEKYSHRCFTKFYGFLKEKDKNIGLVYEYLCNESLYTKIYSHQNKLNEIFCLLTMNRIFEGINYLHSNNLIYRDLKPDNILFDHDFIPYISDFNTIRSIQNENKSSDFSANLGSFKYSSPEQDRGDNLTTSTDIYSFGLVIYFLFESKSMRLNNNSNSFLKSKDEIILPITRSSKNIQDLYKKCVNYDPAERIKNEEIKNIINNELTSFNYLDEIISNDELTISNTEIIQFIFEIICKKYDNNNILNNFFDNIINFQLLFDSKKLLKEKNSLANLYLGDCYKLGKFVKKNYYKAKICYQVASIEKNSDALLNLGYFYEKGFGGEQNYWKAKDFYSLSAKQNNSQALLNLGNLYKNGKGVPTNKYKAKKYYELAEKMGDSNALLKLGSLYEDFDINDYSKARQSYQKAIEQNNPKAYYKLGNLYIDGYRFKKDFLKAKQYFEQGAFLNDKNCFYMLGSIYQNGNDVPVNFSKAKEYFERAAQLGSTKALLKLGSFYKNGVGVQQNYIQAKKYCEIAAELDDSDALVELGNLYLNGYGVKKDHSIALNYYELAANKSNCAAYDFLIDLSQKSLSKTNYYDLLSNIKDLNALYNLGVHFFIKNNYFKAKLCYELSSKANFTDAFVELGNIYYYGYGVSKNILKSIQFYELAANLKHPEAIMKLGDIYYKGYDYPTNFDKAKYYYEKAAKQNNSDAYVQLGDMYYYGEGVETDYTKSKFYYEKAAELNNEHGFHNLGYIYYYGLDIPKDYFKAKEYFLFTQYTFPRDAISLGLIYESNELGQPSFDLAKQCYELAIQNDYPLGFIFLGYLYEDGLGVKKDFYKAKEFYEKAIFNNEPLGFLSLGYLYEQGFGVKRNLSKAKEFYEKAALNKVPQGFICLGYLYERGLGVKKNFTIAKELYVKALQLEEYTAYIFLGLLYEHGSGVTTDYLKAKYYYEKAIMNGILDAFNNLGNLYFYGFGVKQDYFQAYAYYQIASKQNSIDALNNIGFLFENDYIPPYLLEFYAQNKYLNAKKYYELASKKNDINSFLNIGNLYKNGNGVQQNYLEALKYYELAANDNNSDALFYLGEFFSRGDIFEIDAKKAIEYFLRCYKNSENKNELVDNYSVLGYKYKGFDFRSCNEIGLIYLIDLNDIKNANFYISKAACEEFSFAQNNLGLLYQFYFNNFEKAEDCYNNSLKQKFALAEYNLGYLLEINGKNNSIEHYIKASEYEDEPLIYKNYRHLDKRLEISKIFIICFTNLKLVNYYITNSNYCEARKFFIKSCSKFKFVEENSSYNFHFPKNLIQKKFSYLKSFYFNYPLFNLKNQPNLNINFDFADNFQQEDKDFMKINKNILRKLLKSNDKNYLMSIIKNEGNKLRYMLKDSKEIIDKLLNSKSFLKLKDKKFNYNYYNQAKTKSNDIYFEDPCEFFDFVIENDILRKLFISELNEILQMMEKILYTPPYLILFGRINVQIPKNKSKYQNYPLIKDINESFYEGLDISEFKYNKQ